jgi:hypothetical protein
MSNLIYLGRRKSMKNQCPEKGGSTTSSFTDITQSDQPSDSESKYEIESPSRRQFLSAAGGFTAATLAANAVGLPALADAAGMSAEVYQQTTPQSLEMRRARALEIRERAANFQLSQSFPEPQDNGDEDRFPAGLVSFSKALPHNKLGEVDQNAYRMLLQAINSGNPSDFAQIPLGGTVRLANPQSAYAFELEGADSHALTAEAPPPFASEEFAGEMVECYWLALTREIPFSQYGNEPMTAAAIDDLSRFSEFENVNAGTLFRSEDIPGVQIGPYISQFLLQPYLFGSTLIEQRYRASLPGIDHLTSYQTWLDLQNGVPALSAERFEDVPTYIHNGRALGEFVHRNFPYQTALIAALILLGYGDEALDDANPYKGSSTQSGFITFGAPHLLDLIARVANHALKGTWYQKWAVHRRLRPEEFGGRIHNHITGAAQYPINSKLLDSPALASVFSKYGTYLCPQAFPEGCSTHPAYPGGNATFNAAGITVLKAFFDESFVIPNPVVPSEDGLSLRPWRGEPLTIGNELNKLAFNVAFGRNTAGVHFRRDELRGIRLGQTSAVSVMTDFNATYNEGFDGFSLNTFEGTDMTLNVNPALL